MEFIHSNVTIDPVTQCWNWSERATGCIILENHYRTLREATKALKISSATLCKYTDKNTKVFNVDAYRVGCIKAKRKPRI